MDQSILAAGRFGYGAGADGVRAIDSDPRGWLKNQLAHPEQPASLQGLPPSPETMVAIERFREERKLLRAAEPRPNGTGVGKLIMPNGAAPNTQAPAPNPQAKAAGELYQREVAARFAAATASGTPFIERLVAFWSNHFTVSAVRGEVRPLAGAYEREAIRPYVLGRFEDMVLAVVQHPAMALYLDNAVSVGPDSLVGRRRNRGLNENLGRELLELHTLGVDGGYSEQDVRALARILTGWSIARLEDSQPGHFRFFEPVHEPGPKTLLGQTIPEGGMDEGRRAIAILARHPSTARHIARKLAIHFIADQPPAAAVDALAQSFMGSAGNLKAVMTTLIDRPEVWEQGFSKIKTPWDYAVSTARVTGLEAPPPMIVGTLSRLGQPVFHAPSPAGWGDDAASWIGPESVIRRIEWAQAVAGKLGQNQDALELARTTLGDAMPPTLEQAITRAESRQSALALLLASPQFQRR